MRLSNIPCEYRNVDSVKKLTQAVEDFRKSKLRYLYLSCHADTDGIAINGYDVSNAELAEIFKGNVKKKRLFLSACKAGNRNMATAFINKSGGQSIIGAPIDLYFDKAALFWPSFFHVINMAEQDKMNKQSLSKTLKQCVDLFEIPINYYHAINNQEMYLRRYKFRHNKVTTNKKVLMTKQL